jgi:hypothetical protein
LGVSPWGFSDFTLSIGCVILVDFDMASEIFVCNSCRLGEMRCDGLIEIVDVGSRRTEGDALKFKWNAVDATLTEYWVRVLNGTN